jgi:hypothetical protein
LLKAPEGVPSATFATLLTEIGSAIAAAEQVGRDALARSLDPSVLDPAARGVAHDAEYAVQRYRNATAALTPHLQATIKREAQDAWESEASGLRNQVEEAGANFKEGYTEHAGALVTLFRTSAALDLRVISLNARKPPGVSRFVSSRQRRAVFRSSRVRLSPCNASCRHCRRFRSRWRR